MRSRMRNCSSRSFRGANADQCGVGTQQPGYRLARRSGCQPSRVRSGGARRKPTSLNAYREIVEALPWAVSKPPPTCSSWSIKPSFGKGIGKHPIPLPFISG